MGHEACWRQSNWGQTQGDENHHLLSKLKLFCCHLLALIHLWLFTQCIHSLATILDTPARSAMNLTENIVQCMNCCLFFIIKMNVKNKQQLFCDTALNTEYELYKMMGFLHPLHQFTVLSDSSFGRELHTRFIVCAWQLLESFSATRQQSKTNFRKWLVNFCCL